MDTWKGWLWLLTYIAFYAANVLFVWLNPDPHAGFGEVLPIYLISMTGSSLIWAAIVAWIAVRVKKDKMIFWNWFHPVFFASWALTNLH